MHALSPQDTGSQIHRVQAGLWESWCGEVTRPVARPSHGRQGAGLAVQSQWEQGTATRPPVPSSRLTNLNHAGLQAPAQLKDCGKATQLHCRGACGPIEAWGRKGRRSPRTLESPSPGGGGRELIDSCDVSTGGGAAPKGGRTRRREQRPQSAASEIKGPFHTRDVPGPEDAAGIGTVTQGPGRAFTVPRLSDLNWLWTWGRRRLRMLLCS